MWIQRFALVDAVRRRGVDVARCLFLYAVMCQTAVHLVRRRIDERRLRRKSPRRVEDVEGADDVRLEVVPGVGDGGGDGHLACEVQYDVERPVLAEYPVDRLGVPHVGPNEIERGRGGEPFDVQLRRGA